MMLKEPTQLEKKWIAAWRTASPELERIRNMELSTISDEQATLQATYLGTVNACPPIATSGLYELQQWMLRWRKKLEQTK